MKIKVGDKLEAIVQYLSCLVGCRSARICNVEVIKIEGVLFKIYSCKLEDGNVVRLSKSDFILKA